MLASAFLNKYRITLFGLGGGLAFAALCKLFYLLDHGQMILFFLYTPGLFFGLAMFFALRPYSDEPASITIISIFEYIIIVFFSGTDYGYLEPRRLLMGGIGALLFLASLKISSRIDLKLSDYILGFIAGTAASFFMWTDNFTSFDPWLTILAVVAWQTIIAAVINRRILAHPPHFPVGRE
jgi:hypothetical protein